MAETIESERTTVALAAMLRLGAVSVDLSAWLQGVVQMLLECPQAKVLRSLLHIVTFGRKFVVVLA
jgi:hypothetical protein